MNKLNLISISKDILNIELYMNNQEEYKNGNWEIKIFQQWWGNTSGGFEGIGGSALTRQMTYVIHNNIDAYVFFSGRFAYKIKINNNFINDLANENIAGRETYKKCYIE